MLKDFLRIGFSAGVLVAFMALHFELLYWTVASIMAAIILLLRFNAKCIYRPNLSNRETIRGLLFGAISWPGFFVGYLFSNLV